MIEYTDHVVYNVMDLMDRAGFFNNKDINYPAMHKAMAKSYAYPYLHKAIITPCFEYKAHSAAFRIQEREYLIHHMVAEKGNGAHNLEVMAKWLVSHYNQIDWVHAWYRPDNSWPAKIFGGIAEAAEDSICSQKPYGYRLHMPIPIPGPDQMADIANIPVYMPLQRLVKLKDSFYFNTFFNQATYQAFTYTGDYIGTITKFRSRPWLNASNLLNCNIFDLAKPVEFGLIDSQNEDIPTLWNPVDFVTDQEPMKIYNRWKIKMDKKSIALFGL